MTYELDGNPLLLPLHRADILDISPGDAISVKGFPEMKYLWTTHDSEFVESNPDDDIFLVVERVDDNVFQATGIVLK